MKFDTQPETLQAPDNGRPEEDNTTGCEGGARHKGTHGEHAPLFDSRGRELAANFGARVQRLGERIRGLFK